MKVDVADKYDVWPVWSEGDIAAEKWVCTCSYGMLCNAITQYIHVHLKGMQMKREEIDASHTLMCVTPRLEYPG